MAPVSAHQNYFDASKLMYYLINKKFVIPKKKFVIIKFVIKRVISYKLFCAFYFVLCYTSKFGIARFFPYVKICPTLIIRYTVFFVISKFAVERVDCIISCIIKNLSQ